jgi:hypothetical protein
LRISSRPAPPPQPPPGTELHGSTPAAAPRTRGTAVPRAEPKSQLVKVGTTILLVACIGLALWHFGSKWNERVRIAAQVASALSEAGADAENSGGAKNLWYDNCAVLFIRHSNHLEVAAACKEHWKVKLHKNLVITDSQSEFENPGEFELIPPHNGYVRIVTAHEWPAAQQEALAQQLSEQFGTLVFEWCSEDFADTYHFGVYNQGKRKFHAQMDIKFTGNDFDEIVTTEGNEFAIANGFKPGPKGFKEFGVLDADKITQALGMKLWDEKQGTEAKTILLKEIPPPARN